ncbi:MAG: hypothetical protein MRY64_08350 [Hyphomonadaceae bacterium]|nr:hypothetical protein [Hyphomonadaceae bacterium]
MIKALILLSAGRHPVSGRARCARLDALALEMALSLAPPAQVMAVHAGDPGNPALRGYLGMGLTHLTVLDLPEGHDPVPSLIEHVRAEAPDIVFAGNQAEIGEGSGTVPYLIAEATGASVARDVIAVELLKDGLHVRQALPKGLRQETARAFPAILCVAPQAPPARQQSFARAREGEIVTRETAQTPERFLPGCTLRPYKPRSALNIPSGSAMDRLRAATEVRAGEERVLIDPQPDKAAEEIIQYLTAKGVLRKPRQ